MQLKVLFINTVYGQGSTGRIVAELGQALEEQGDEYMVAYGRGKAREDKHGYRIGSTMDTYIHAGLSRITDRAGFYSVRATEKLLDFIRVYNPDVIHLHNLHGYYLNIRILFNYLKNEYTGKVLWTLHDCWALTGHCTYYNFVKCDRWKQGCEHCPQRHTYPQSLLSDASVKNYRDKKRLFTSLANKLTVVTVSRWLENDVRQSFLHNSNILTVHNGVDTEIFKKQKNCIREKYNIGDRYMFLCVSDGWDRRKGYDKVLELSNRIHPDSVIVMIGLNKKQIAQLPKNIIGLERTWDVQELVNFYNAANVLFNPSNEETFGLVTAEAMACGTPVIVYNTTACPEVAGDNRCGRILEQNESIADVINELYIDKTLKSDNCRDRIENFFSLTGMKQQYLRLYEGILNNNEVT